MQQPLSVPPDLLRRQSLIVAGGSTLLALAGCGGGQEDLSQREPTELQPPRLDGGRSLTPGLRRRALDVGNERQSVLLSRQTPTWVYYTQDTTVVDDFRWYISPLHQGNTQVGAYSLGPIVQGEASWWTVSSDAITLSQNGAQITVRGNLDTDPSDSFYDIGRHLWLSDASIHRDRQLLQGDSVRAKWYFFQAPNGYWYIIPDPQYAPPTAPLVKRFAELNGKYNWVDVDGSGQVALFNWDQGSPILRFSPVTGYADANVGLRHNMDGQYGAQCVDLMHHYIDSALGIAYPHGFTGDAYSIFQNAPDSSTRESSIYGTVTFQKVINTPSAVPEPGDIIFWSSPDPGHVAIVIEADINRFQSLDQNWVNPPSPDGTPAARVEHNYHNVAGWLSPRW